MIHFPAKESGEALDYLVSFAAQLEQGETITGHTVTVTGATLGSHSVSGGNAVQFMLTAGTPGTVARTTVTAVTSAGRTHVETALVPIGGLPVDLGEIKAWLRIEHDDEDAMLGALATAAVSAIEEETSLCLTPRIVRQQPVTGFPAVPGALLRLWKGPVKEIVAIEYDPAGGGTAVPLASFRLVEGRGGGLLPAYGAAWPATIGGAGSVRIDYLAGFEPEELPPVLAQAVKLLVGHWYGNRGEGSSGMPAWLKTMLAPFAPVGLA